MRYQGLVKHRFWSAEVSFCLATFFVPLRGNLFGSMQVVLVVVGLVGRWSVVVCGVSRVEV